MIAKENFPTANVGTAEPVSSSCTSNPKKLIALSFSDTFSIVSTVYALYTPIKLFVRTRSVRPSTLNISYTYTREQIFAKAVGIFLCHLAKLNLFDARAQQLDNEAKFVKMFHDSSCTKAHPRSGGNFTRLVLLGSCLGTSSIKNVRSPKVFTLSRDTFNADLRILLPSSLHQQSPLRCSYGTWTLADFAWNVTIVLHN